MTLADLFSFKTGPETNTQRVGLRMIGIPESMIERIPTPVIRGLGRGVGPPPTPFNIEIMIRSFRQKQLLAGAAIAAVLYLLFMRG